MEISQLRYFVEVCKCGNIVDAAKNMHITQQGVSIAIRRLETEINHDLFYQKNRKLVLTKFGADFRPRAESVIAQMDKLMEFVNAAMAEDMAHIRVAISRGTLTKLPPALQTLLVSDSNEVTFEVIEAYSTECAEMVQSGHADFALAYGNYDPAVFDAVLLENTEQVFIVNRKNPLARQDAVRIEDMDNAPFLLPDLETRPSMEVIKLFQEANCTLRVLYKCNWPHQAVDMVSNNEALIARIQRSDLSERDMERVKPLPLKDREFMIPFYLLTKRNRKLSVHEKLAKHIIVDCFRENRDEREP